MSREIRRVPANWQHPTYRTMRLRPGFYGEIETWKPLLNSSFAEQLAEWEERKAAWDSGQDPDRAKYPDMSFEEWHGEKPEADYYVPYDPNGDLPWWQMYETVSEGTPVTPAFATPEELIEFLVENGQQYEGGETDGPWERERAEKFVRDEGWFPSFVVKNGVFATAKEGMPK